MKFISFSSPYLRRIFNITVYMCVHIYVCIHTYVYIIFMSTLSLILSRRQRTCCLDISDDRSDEYGCKNWSFQLQSDPPSFHVLPMQQYSLPHCIVCPCRAVIVPLFACLAELGNGHQAAFARMFSLTHALLLGRILSHIPSEFFFFFNKSPP